MRLFIRFSIVCSLIFCLSCNNSMNDANSDPAAIDRTPNRPVLVASDGKITATWDSVKNVTLYEVWYGTSADIASAKPYTADSDVSDLQCELTGLMNNTEYFIWIRSVSINGKSPFSIPSRATPIAPLPSGLAVTSVSCDFLDISWSVLSGADGYRLYYATDPAGTYSQIGGDITDLAYIHTGLNPHTTYYYKLSAYNSNGESNTSDFIAGTTSKQYGLLDSSFVTGNGTTDSLANLIYATAVQSDNKVLIGGNFKSYYDGTSRYRIARINEDGSLDTTFNPGTGFNYPDQSVSWVVNSISVQSNGILVGGDFTTYNGISRKSLVRLNTDGSLDTSFNSGGSGPDSSVGITLLQSDGKILITGGFSSYNGIARAYIARLNANGTLDTAFNATGGGPNNNISAIALQNDGKILIGGSFTSYNNAGTPTLCDRILRLNSDGTIDTSFTIGSGTNADVYAIAIQSDGKIIIGGAFSRYNGNDCSYIARLNSNGSYDTSFTCGTGPNGNVGDILLQSDAKIIIAGSFSTYNGVSRNGLARLNGNGSLDYTFNTGSGPDHSIMSMSIDSLGRIVLGGSFTTYNDVTVNHIARIIGK